jgi:hypothetical protein
MASVGTSLTPPPHLKSRQDFSVGRMSGIAAKETAVRSRSASLTPKSLLDIFQIPVFDSHTRPPLTWLRRCRRRGKVRGCLSFALT